MDFSIVGAGFKVVLTMESIRNMEKLVVTRDTPMIFTTPFPIQREGEK
jgi:hypothetical protein